MFPREFNSAFELTIEEKDQLVTNCEAIADALLGKASSDSAQDVIERRRQDGTLAKLARTALLSDGVVVGHQLDFELFDSEEVIEEQEDNVVYKGLSFTLNVDVIAREFFRKQGLGTMTVFNTGYYEIDIDMIIGELKDSELPTDATNLSAQFLHDDIDTSDQMYIYDIRNILTKL